MAVSVSTAKVESHVGVDYGAHQSIIDIGTEEDPDLLEYAVLLTLERHAALLNMTDDDEDQATATRFYWQTRIL